MKQATFLVTSLSSVRKASFVKRVKELLNANFEVVLLIALVKFSEIHQVKKELALICDGNQHPVKMIAMESLFDNQSGVPLNPDELVNNDLSQFNKYEETKEMHSEGIRFVDDDGNLVAQMSTHDNGAYEQGVFYDQNSHVVQINNYDQSGQLTTIEKYANNQLIESLIINNVGQLVYRFVVQMSDIKSNYQLAKTSLLTIPETGITTNNSSNKELTSNYVVTKKALIQVINYHNYYRYENINDFYNDLLKSVGSTNSRIYVDIDQLVDIASYLDTKQIFSY